MTYALEGGERVDTQALRREGNHTAATHYKAKSDAAPVLTCPVRLIPGARRRIEVVYLPRTLPVSNPDEMARDAPEDRRGDVGQRV